MTTGKKFIRRTSINRREAGMRNSSQQRNAWFQIMFNLSRACETLFSTSQRQSSFPLKAKLGTGQPYTQDMALVPLQHSWELWIAFNPPSLTAKGMGMSSQEGLPCHQGMFFSGNPKMICTTAKQLPSFILAALPLISRPMSLLGSFSLCAAEISSVVPREL